MGLGDIGQAIGPILGAFTGGLDAGGGVFGSLFNTGMRSAAAGGAWHAGREAVDRMGHLTDDQIMTLTGSGDPNDPGHGQLGGGGLIGQTIRARSAPITQRIAERRESGSVSPLVNQEWGQLTNQFSDMARESQGNWDAFDQAVESGVAGVTAADQDRMTGVRDRYAEAQAAGDRAIQTMDQFASDQISTATGNYDAAIGGIVNDISTRSEAISQAATSNLDQSRAAIDKMENAGELPPAAAAQQRMMAEVQTGENILTQQHRVFTDMSRTLASARMSKAQGLQQQGAQMANMMANVRTSTGQTMAAERQTFATAHADSVRTQLAATDMQATWRNQSNMARDRIRNEAVALGTDRINAETSAFLTDQQMLDNQAQLESSLAEANGMDQIQGVQLAFDLKQGLIGFDLSTSYTASEFLSGVVVDTNAFTGNQSRLYNSIGIGNYLGGGQPQGGQG